MWDSIAAVSSGLTLVAFLIAAGVWAYRQRLIQTERLIKSASEEQRAGLVEKVFENVSVDTSALTREQRYQLAIRLIEKRSHKFTISAIVIVVIAIITAVLAGFAISRQSTNSEPTTNYFANPLPFNTGWIFVGYHDKEKEKYVEGPMVRIIHRPTGSISDVPKIGDVLQIDKTRKVIIANYKTSGIQYQMESPALVNAQLTDNDDTGIVLSPNTLVIVRDVEISGYYDRPVSIWCRIAACDVGSVQCQEALNRLKKK
jgi:hypothetical protein